MNEHNPLSDLSRMMNINLPNQGTFAGSTAMGAAAAIGGVVLGAFLYEEISKATKQQEAPPSAPSKAVNPYRGVPSTVAELEALILSQPLTAESRKMLKALAQLPEDAPLPKNLLPQGNRS